jgi:hypothetical protein
MKRRVRQDDARRKRNVTPRFVCPSAEYPITDIAYNELLLCVDWWSA